MARSKRPTSCAASHSLSWPYRVLFAVGIAMCGVALSCDAVRDLGNILQNGDRVGLCMATLVPLTFAWACWGLRREPDWWRPSPASDEQRG